MFWTFLPFSLIKTGLPKIMEPLNNKSNRTSNISNISIPYNSFVDKSQHKNELMMNLDELCQLTDLVTDFSRKNAYLREALRSALELHTKDELVGVSVCLDEDMFTYLLICPLG